MKKIFKNITKDQIMKELKKIDGLNFCLEAGNCCGTCTWAKIRATYGKESTGVWIKHYESGSNASPWEKQEHIFIAHALTNEQEDQAFKLLNDRFFVEWDGDSSSCFTIHNGSVELQAYGLYCLDTHDNFLNFNEFLQNYNILKFYKNKAKGEEPQEEKPLKMFGDFYCKDWSESGRLPRVRSKNFKNVYVIEKGCFYYVYDEKDNLLIKKRVGSKGTLFCKNKERGQR
jgi:hypothetical protein